MKITFKKYFQIIFLNHLPIYTFSRIDDHERVTITRFYQKFLFLSWCNPFKSCYSKPFIGFIPAGGFTFLGFYFRHYIGQEITAKRVVIDKF